MRLGIVYGAALAALTVAACDQRLAVQPARDHSLAEASAPAAGVVQTVGASGDAVATTRTSIARSDTPRAEDATPVKLVEGRPMWSDNKRHSAQENAQYQFERHGTELGAKSLDEFVVKAHHFLNAPPEGTKTLTRANGDKLLFDPRSKLFGVVRADGAPRTVFKPDDGQAYWDQQVASGGDDRANTSSRKRTASRGGGDNAS